MGDQNKAGQTSKADIDRKISDLCHAIELNPKNGGAYRERGLQYIHLGNFDRALSDLDQAISLNPRDPHAYYYRGYIFRIRKEGKKQL